MGYAIEIVGLKKTYRSGVRRRSVTALNGLDLCVNRNEIFGFLGPNGAGKTIFFSSHILQDAELLCDHVGILREGRLVNTGTLQEMLTPKLASYEAVVTDIPEDAIEELSHIATKLEKREERFHLLINGTENLRRMERIVAQSGGLMDSLSKTRGTLEDHFIEFINPQPGEAVNK